MDANFGVNLFSAMFSGQVDFDKIYDNFDSRSDLEVAILGCSLLDDTLKAAIYIYSQDRTEKFLEPIFNYPGFLSSIVSRVEFCYIVGILNAGMRQDIKAIANCRNKFGHLNKLMSFGDVELDKYLNKIQIYDKDSFRFNADFFVKDENAILNRIEYERSGWSAAIVSKSGRIIAGFKKYAKGPLHRKNRFINSVYLNWMLLNLSIYSNGRYKEDFGAFDFSVLL